LGEDACLLDDEETQDDDYNDVSENHDDVAGCGDVNDLTEDCEKEVKNISMQPPNPDSSVKGTSDVNSTPSDPLLTKGASPSSNATCTNLVDKNILKEMSGKNDIILSGDGGGKVGEKRVVKRTSSCPPSRVRFTEFGTWSLEWVNKHQKHDSDSLFSSKKKNIQKKSYQAASKVTKKKGSGYLRHCAQSLKCIARLPDKDHREVLRVLRRTMKQRRAVSEVSKVKVMSKEGTSHSDSQSSVNNDWQKWLVLHCDDKAMNEDVCGIGQVVGLKFSGDKNNKFDILLGAGRKKDGGGAKDV
jgi:hypothetical protein